MKNYGSCVYCGKIDGLIFNLCRECYNEEIDNIQKVKEILLKFPNSNAIDLAIKTDIPIDKITRLIKKGTLI